MTLRKLLAATSIMALTAAGSAQALSVETSVGEDALVPALELALPGNPGFSQTITTSVLTDTGNFPAGNNITVTLELPDDVLFADDVSGDNVTATADDGSDVAISAIVQGGSGAEDTGNVELLVSIPEGAEVASINVAFDYLLDDCVSDDATVTMTAFVGDTPLEEGTAESDDPIVGECASAISGDVESDVEDSDTLILLADDFETLGPDGVLGFVEYVIEDDVVINGDGDLLEADDIDSITFDVVIENADGLAETLTVGGVDCELDGLAYECEFEGADIDDLLADGGAAITIAALTGDDAEAINTQNISVQNAVVTFNTAADEDFITNEMGANGVLDGLNREGQTFGVFDWNGGTPTQTVSVYRVTGFDPAETVDFTVTMSNSPVDGTFAGTVTADAYGRAVLFSTGFGDAAVPPYNNGDASLNFETTNELDVDRLLARNGVITSFNGGANQDDQLGNDPREDADNGR